MHVGRESGQHGAVLADRPGGAAVPHAPSEAAEQLAVAEALLDATAALSQVGSTTEAADVLADVACRLLGADGAHVYLPDELGGSLWSNTNSVRGAAPAGTLTFDITREIPDLAPLLAAGQDVFVADGFAPDAGRRALRLRHGMRSLMFLPLRDTGALALWWTEQQDTAPVVSPYLRSFLQQAGQAVHRLLETATLRDLTVTDPLTRLVNRRGLLQQLEQLADTGALLLMDLDHFKRVNDTYGHRYGDQVLQAFARVLRDLTPDAACCARWGGEEFAVVLPTGGRQAASHLFDQLRARWAEQGMTFSAGLAEHRDGARAEETFEAADRALYVAKQRGRDTLVHAPDVAWSAELPVTGLRPRPRPAVARAAAAPVLTLADLDEAIDRGMVQPWYQPVIETGGGRVVAVEALARLQHPGTGEVLEPSAFLPLAERTGRVRRLDTLVANASIADVATLRRQGFDISVGINLSVDHLDDPELPGRLLQRCTDSGLSHDALIVEITETMQSMTGRGHTASIRRLSEAGVNVTLDDFGTGFSALEYLLRFPVAGIKIDQCFTAALGTARGRQLTTSLIDIAVSLEMHVVAEGVETSAQLDWLTAQGCPFAQGFLVGAPVPRQAVTRLIEEIDARAGVPQRAAASG